VFGAVAGFGGGIIIKPTLEAIGAHDAATVAFLSVTAVFLMALISTAKQINGGAKPDNKLLFPLIIGSAAGGLAGNLIMSKLYTSLILNNIILIALMIFSIIVFNVKIKTLHIENWLFILFFGLAMGFLSAYLSIGGGPFILAFLMLLFSVDIKKATVYSIAIILCSQAINLLLLFIYNGFKPYDLSLLLFTLPAAAIGGYVGAMLNKKISAKAITRVLNVFLIIIMIICIYNIIKGAVL